MQPVTGEISQMVADAEVLMLRLEPEPNHVLQVRLLALQLFDEIMTYLNLRTGDRPYLEAAALLHDIGWSISGRGHHKHSANLILEHGLPAATEREAMIIAAIARAHRKSEPQPKHYPYGRLSKNDQKLVVRLAALLRVADGLDRGHRAAIYRIKTRVDTPGEMVLELHCTMEPDIELFGFNRKKDLLEELLGLPLRPELIHV